MKTIKIVAFCFFFMATALVQAGPACCHLPKQGATGAAGVQGPVGPTGATGSQGPTGTENFASVSFVYAGVDQVVAAQDNIIFPSADVVQGNISYDDTTGVFTLTDTGYYLVQYGVSGSPNNDQIALRLNSELLPISGSAIDIQSSILQGIAVIFNVTTPVSTFQAINNEASAAITINATNTDSLAAYLFIMKL